MIVLSLLKLFVLLISLCVVNAYEIELCNNSNRGDCNCGFGDIKTYVFTPGDYQRCIHTFIPDSADSSNPLPVLVSVNGYGQGRLFPGSEAVAKARYYGYALFGIGSTGPFDGAGGFGLEFPANGVINPSNPTPCSASDSRDYGYIEGILDFIANEATLDTSKVYFEGFSQSSMFSVYASVCFADRIAGLWQGGSGLAKTFHQPITPGWQGQCSASDFDTYGNDCCTDHFCTDCTWWPIYPRTCENKLIDCIATYTNDNIACGTDFYAYEAMVAEGNDARMLSFSPSSDGPGGHRNPENKFSWMVGCLGIVDSCSDQCEASFLECIETNSVDEFARCEVELGNGNLSQCTPGCAPTLEMLKTSESPVINLSEGNFGTQTGLGVTTVPQQPSCNNAFGSFEDIGYHNKCLPPVGQGAAVGEIETCLNAPTPTPPTATSIPTTPTSTPPTSMSSCSDTTLRLKIVKNNGNRITRNCGWVGARNTVGRCALDGVSAACADTCGTCDTCIDASLRFKVIKNDGNKITRGCAWVINNNNRCLFDGVGDTCRSTCGKC